MFWFLIPDWLERWYTSVSSVSQPWSRCPWVPQSGPPWSCGELKKRLVMQVYICSGMSREQLWDLVLPVMYRRRWGVLVRFWFWRLKVNQYLPNLDVEAPVWLDALERSYRPWQMAYFRPFSNIISIKTSRAARKNTSNMADVRQWRHRVTSLQVLYRSLLELMQRVPQPGLDANCEDMPTSSLFEIWI
jgi:hypothetical protein